MGRVIMGNRELLNSGEEAKECLITLDRTVEPESEIEALLSELEVLRRENEELSTPSEFRRMYPYSPVTWRTTCV